MKRYIAGALVAAPGLIMAQSAIDAYRFAPNEIKGTARFVAMGGAFGAVGGDLSVLSQNPAGIGIYRKHEIGATINVDAQRSSAEAFGSQTDSKQTKFLFNNVGGVLSVNLPSETCPNLNLGFTYNKTASFNRHYRGTIPTLSNSISNYFAGISRADGVSVDELTSESSDPYLNGYTPWGSILAYDGYLMYNVGDNEVPEWIGQWNDRTSGAGAFDIEEKGGINEFNIALGGNIKNVVYWGMDFGITDFSYTMNAGWGEKLQNAYIDEHFVDETVDSDKSLVYGSANSTLQNYYHAYGTGFNYKLGFIVKPIQELRLGFAFHTPTWTSMKEDFGAALATRYGNETEFHTETTNGGYSGFNNYNYRSPWKFIFSAAGVIGSQFIISADYELATYGSMKFSEYTYPSSGGGYYDDYWYDNGYDYWPFYANTRANGNDFLIPSYGDQNDPYYFANKDIKTYYKNQSTLRVGAEYRVIPQFSLRAGFAYLTSPVKKEVRDNKVDIYTSGTMPNYTFDNETYYISFGFGYRYQKFYVDLAYQYRHQSADYHAFTPDPKNPGIPSPQSKLSLENNNVVLSMGFKF